MLSKEQFKKYMGIIKKTQEDESKLQAALEAIDKSNFLSLYGDQVSTMIDLVSILMDLDIEGDWNDISYFIYELDWGKKWTPGCVIDTDKKTGKEINVDISTLDKLYRYLVKCSKDK